MGSEGNAEVECSSSGFGLRQRGARRPRRHSVKNTWRQFRGSLRLLSRRGLAVSPGRVQDVGSSPESICAVEEAQEDLDDDAATSSSQCSSGGLGSRNRAPVHTGHAVLRPRTRARSESSWSSCSVSVSPCSPARSRSPVRKPAGRRHERKSSRQNLQESSYGSLSRCEQKHFLWARNVFCGEHQRRRKHRKRHRRSTRTECHLPEETPQTSLASEEEALLRSVAPKAKALESPEAGRQLSEAEPEPEMQASEDDMEMSPASTARGAATLLENLTASSAAVPDQGESSAKLASENKLREATTGSEHKQAQEELAATTAVAGVVSPVDNQAPVPEPISSIAGRVQARDGEQAKDSDEELYLSDLEGMLEEPGDAASNATVLQTPGTQKQTFPEPQGEAAELLAVLRSQAELLNPGDYWLADTSMWDLEALREDVAAQQESLEVGHLEARLSAELEAAARAAAPAKPLLPTTGGVSDVSASTPCYLVRQRQWQARKRVRRKRTKLPLKGKAACEEVCSLGFYEDSQGDRPSNGSTSVAAATPSEMGFCEDLGGDRPSHDSTSVAAATPSDMGSYEDSRGDRPSHGSTSVAATTPSDTAFGSTEAKQVELAKSSLLSRLDALICQEVFGGSLAQRVAAAGHMRS